MNSKHIIRIFIVSTTRIPVDNENMIYKRPITHDGMSFLEKLGDTCDKYKYEEYSNSRTKNNRIVSN